jgi:hypothetical protein
MVAELPLHLKQLEALPSALDILRYLATAPDNAAYSDTIADDLNISETRCGKALRRLVTNQYVVMRSDRVYELGRKGAVAAQELAEYDATAPKGGLPAGKLPRELVVALPRQLVSGQATDVLVGFAPYYGDGFNTPTDVIVRFDALYATLSSRDEMLKLDNGAYRQTLTITPQAHDQLRLKVQVFQLSEDGEDLTDCGGMYVDVDVVTQAHINPQIAYNTMILFTA